MMLRKAILSIAIASCAGLALSPDFASACSRILLNADQFHVVGRTMDLYMSDHAKIVVYPRGISRDGSAGSENSAKWVSKFGSVTVKSLDIATSDGINEKGFVANLLYLHDTKYESRDARPGLANSMVLQYLLDTSDSVTGALTELAKIQVVSTVVAGREWPLHISISDATGDSAVIEFDKGKMVVHRGRTSDVMTNEPPLDWQLNNLKRYKYFGGTEPLPGDIDPASRFVRASAFLKTSPKPKSNEEALAAVYGIAKTVSVPLGAQNTAADPGSEDTWPTLWTTIADSSQKLYFFQAADSPNMFWVDLSKVNFAEGAPVMTVSGQDPTLSGEVSSQMKPANWKL